MAVPKIIPYDVELRSVNPVRSFDRPKAYTNDLKSVEFQFKILDMTSTDLETATAITLVYMRDGSFFANPSTDVSRVGNVFSYLLKENEGNHAGVAQIQLVVTVDGMELASQLFDFEIINGLETKVAQEVMIYDWTTLTRDARAYIDQFVADEVFRDAQFDNAQFDRNTAFVASQDARALAFGTEQTNRGTAFTAEQNERTTAFNESESGRTTAETGRVTAEDGRVIAENNRVTKEGQRVTAETNRVTAEDNRVTAESGRVTAENARVTAETNRAAAFTAFDTRLTAEETATANNKISTVKGKTFADVDARLEDVEFDTTMMASGLINNGNFSDTSGWIPLNATISAGNNELNITPTSLNVEVGVYRSSPSVSGNLTYISAEVYPKYDRSMQIGFYNGNKLPTASLVPNTWNRLSGRLVANAQAYVFYHNMASSYVLTDTFKLRNIMAIDLTVIFGKGNEPTAEQMDGIMAKFTNSWFNGTANLFRANATLNKLMAVDARTEFEAKNLITNGDFSNGATTGWLGYMASVTNENGKLKVTATVAGPYAQAYMTLSTIVGNKYYIRQNYTPGTVGPSIVNPVISSASSNTFTATQIATQIKYSSGTVVIGDYYYIDDVILIDLTATFGSGKEPTLAEMNRMMARFPNSWFDGVKPIQTIETLYQEKANKTQEAWITPTLLNGWVQFEPNSNAAYMKDEFGFVHLKGKLKSGIVATDLFSLPVGYRSNYSKVFPCSSSGNVAAIVISNVVYINSGANNASISLDGITFKAEV